LQKAAIFAAFLPLRCHWAASDCRFDFIEKIFKKSLKKLPPRDVNIFASLLLTAPNRSSLHKDE